MPLLLITLGVLFWLDYSFILPLKEIDANDVTFFWSATRTVVLGGNPYEALPGNLYHEIRVAVGGDPQFIDSFKSPVFLTLLFLPLAAFPLGVAATLWTLLTQCLLVITVILLIKGLTGEMSPRKLLAGIGLALLWRYSFLVMLVGNLSLLLLLAITASWFCSYKQRPYLAGATAALLMIKPQITFLIVPLLLTIPTAAEPGEKSGWFNRATFQRVIGFGLAGTLFFTYSFAVLPSWLGQWLTTLFGPDKAYFNNRSIDSQLTSLRSIVAALVVDPTLVQPAALLISVPLWLGAAGLWWRYRNNSAAFPFLLSLITALNILTSPYIRDYDSTILLFGLLFCFFTLRQYEIKKLTATRWSLLCWGLAFLPYPIHFLAAGTSYAFENIITLLCMLLIAFSWLLHRRFYGKQAS